MTEIVLFGGTYEAGALCARLAQKGIPALVCVATPYARALIPPSDTLRPHTGRLDRAAIEALLALEKPRAVIDATHPYAVQAGSNIRSACLAAGVKYLRVLRESLPCGDCLQFDDMPAMVAWLNGQSGNIFSALGAKQAAALTAVEGFSRRVWLRVLPDALSLAACVDAGFPAKHIICMQGPFSVELNAAMFRAAGADIVLTKESGTAGGFEQKRIASQQCGAKLCVLARPRETGGLPPDDVMRIIEEDRA